jgi:hypothetical protein
MIDESLPYYVMDFVRKSHEHIDEALIKKNPLKPHPCGIGPKQCLFFQAAFS